MQLTVNGIEVSIHASTLSGLIIEMSLPRHGVAIAVNNEIVPKSLWESYLLKEASKIEVVTAAAGG